VKMPALKFAARLAASTAAAWLLSGCAAMRVAYDHADSFLRWKATSYVEVRGADSHELDERIDAFLDWHRSKALPQYAAIAADASRRVGKGLSPEDLVWGYDSFMAQVRETLRAAGERIAPMLDRLSAEQIAHIEMRFAEDNRKFAREFLRGSESDRRKRRTKRAVERMEDWVGKLAPAQLERVRQYSERAPLYDDLRERDRKRLQAQLLATLRARQAQKRLPDALAGFDRGRESAYAAASEAHRKEYNALLLDLDRTLTSEQRAKAAGRLRGFAEDFASLAADKSRRRPQ
jgi:hypothetical protein